MSLTFINDIAFMTDRLRADGVPELAKRLRECGAVIAGSYVLPTKYDDSDIDVWVPWTTNRNTLSRVDMITSYLVDCGYMLKMIKSRTDWRKQVSDTENIPDAYTRMNNTISYMIECKKRESRTIQIIMLKRGGGKTGEDIVNHFDINLIRQYFDGKQIARTPASIRDMDNNTISINRDSKMVRDQTFPEWCRTLTRFMKYTRRGFTTDNSSEYITKYAKSAFSTMSKDIGWYSCCDYFKNVYKLNILHYILEWNLIARYLKLPYIYLTILPSTMNISNIRIGFCKLTDSVRKCFPVEFKGELVPLYVVHYNRLSKGAIDDLITPTCPEEIRRKRKIAYYMNYEKDDNEYPDGYRLPSGIGFILVANLIPYVKAKFKSDSSPCESWPTTCMDVMMVMDDVNIDTFLEENEDGVIFYNGSNKAYGIVVDQLAMSERFIPCEDRGSFYNYRDDDTLNTIVAVKTEITFNIPYRFISYVLANFRQDRKYNLVRTGERWEESLNLRVYEDQTNQFTGGTANMCGVDTDRDIWILEIVDC